MIMAQMDMPPILDHRTREPPGRRRQVRHAGSEAFANSIGALWLIEPCGPADAGGRAAADA